MDEKLLMTTLRQLEEAKTTSDVLVYEDCIRNAFRALLEENRSLAQQSSPRGMAHVQRGGNKGELVCGFCSHALAVACSKCGTIIKDIMGVWSDGEDFYCKDCWAEAFE